MFLFVVLFSLLDFQNGGAVSRKRILEFKEEALEGNKVYFKTQSFDSTVADGNIDSYSTDTNGQTSFETITSTEVDSLDSKSEIYFSNTENIQTETYEEPIKSLTESEIQESIDSTISEEISKPTSEEFDITTTEENTSISDKTSCIATDETAFPTQEQTNSTSSSLDSDNQGKSFFDNLPFAPWVFFFLIILAIIVIVIIIIVVVCIYKRKKRDEEKFDSFGFNLMI